jgi:ATP-dependent DNA helicase DinG
LDHLPTVADILSRSGPVARLLGDKFESRPEQGEMAEAVARALEGKTHLLAEAGTGVGKSYAYLVPAMLRAMHRAETVVIATNTISLQEQLINRDIPLLQEALADSPEVAALAPDPSIVRPLKPVLVKGRGNYVSIRRLRMAVERQDRILPDIPSRRSLAAIQHWSTETYDGSLSSLPQLERPGVWDRVQSDSGNCMGRRCPNYEQCFYQTARRETEDANLLVCNHALFFSDLALRVKEVGFLPDYQHVILDEAHGVEDAASDHFGCSLSEGRVHHLLSTLYHPTSGRGYLSQLGMFVSDPGAVDRTVAKVLQAVDVSRAFFEAVRELVRSGHAPGGRLREPGLIDDIFSPVMKELTLELKLLKDKVKNEQDRFELNAYAERASDVVLCTEVLVNHKAPASVYWAEVRGMHDDGDGGGRFQRVTLACSPIEVGTLLKEHLFAKPVGVVLASATLATSTAAQDEHAERGEAAFSHTLSRLGCEGARTLQLGSPFDYRKQVDFIVDRGSGSPTQARGAAGAGGGQRTPGSGSNAAANDAGSKSSTRPGVGRGSTRGASAGGYTQQLTDRVLHHVRESDGGAFVLFTSFQTLYAVADQAARRLAEWGMPLLVQGRDGSRTAILDRFRQNDRSVLFGAASFWQGVDVRGRGLRNVIITKLPFDPPDRPLTEARGERILARGGDPFSEDSLPRAVIRFKQGFGRLIRSHTDRGRVVCLDERIVTARYGKAFLRALPPGVTPTVVTGDSPPVVRDDGLRFEPEA